MEIIECPVKINLTLRVLSRRSDGYHEIKSLFWKRNANERLTITPLSSENIEDVLTVEGVPVEGENILTRTFDWVDTQIETRPKLNVKIEKKYPTGSGIGAGSGNAAALIGWFADKYRLSSSADNICKLGADVFVLAQEKSLYFAEGIGEILTYAGDEPELHWLIFFPKWRSSTAEAYAKLDDLRKYRKTENIPDCRSEANDILGRLKSGEKVGLLPNDFLLPLTEGHKEYFEIFDLSEKHGAAAWGLCGSGSSAFALLKDLENADELESVLKTKNFIVQTERLGCLK